MKIYISCDIEGLAGIATFDMEKDDTENFRELYHRHVKWVIDGIQQSSRSEEHTSELQSRFELVCRLLLEKKNYSPERVEQAIADGTPVMMDFYADWCVPCLALDCVTFTDSRDVHESENFVRLKVDLPHFD